MAIINFFQRLINFFRGINFFIYDDTINFIDRYGKGGNVLEIGCGCGKNLAYLRKQGYKVFGMDHDENSIESAKKILKNIQCGDVQKLPFDDNKFDIILDRACLQHNKPENIERIIKEIRRVLKPEGILIIINFKSNRDSFTENFKMEKTFRNYDYVHYTDEKEIQGWLKDFEILHFEHRICEITIPKKITFADFYAVGKLKKSQ